MNLLETGIYSVPDAARLTGVAPGRIRRWLRGYSFRYGQKKYTSPAVWQGQWPPAGKSLALGFLDLIEIRFVKAFIEAGVSWATLRLARARAQESFRVSHPFCENRFLTDGRKLLVEVQLESGESSLLDVISRQQVFVQTVRPCFKDLEFQDGRVVRWWPLGEGGTIVVDPRRCFGQPILARSGVPTEALARAAAATNLLAELARWYQVNEVEVRDAVEFEQRLRT